MRFDLDRYAAWRRDHPIEPLQRDVESWMALEIERLREEAHDLRLIVVEAALAENLNAEDAKKERAAVVAWLREHWSEVLEQTPQQTARLIERGEHRREEER